MLSGCAAVFLSGPGGVGKTTVGRHAQRLLADHWLYFEVDRCQPLVPPNPDFATVDNDRRLTRATLQAARSYVTTGFPTLVEMDVISGQRREICEDVFPGVPFHLVVLTARRDVVMRRVQERGTDIQSLETFRAMYDAVAWEDIPAAATIDTSDHPEDQVAAMVAGLIDDLA